MFDWHFDPLNAVLISIALFTGYKAYITGQAKLKQDNNWHSQWIKTHNEECNQRERTYQKMFTELQVNNAKLTEIAAATSSRVDRIEHQLDSSEK